MPPRGAARAAEGGPRGVDVHDRHLAPVRGGEPRRRQDPANGELLEPLGRGKLQRIPLAQAASCALLILSPSLATSGFAYLLFKCMDYSLFRAAKEILYIPLPFDSRYRAKELIDVFGYRFSKGGTSLLIAAAQRATSISSAAFEALYAWIALGAALGWFTLVTPLLRRNRAASP